MEQRNTRLRNAGFVTFFFSGICTISSGVVVSLLQEEYGFAYGMTGTLLSLLSIGNLLAGLLAGALVGKMGMKPSVLLLTIGYAVGYGLMGLTGLPILLALAFFIVGIAKGSVLNTCTILVSGNSADRTRGMNTMHACYACGALLCPFLISAAARVSTTLAVLALAALGLVLWLVYLFTSMAGRAKAFCAPPASGCSPACCSARTPPSRALWAGWSPTSRTAASLQARWRPIPSP